MVTLHRVADRYYSIVDGPRRDIALLITDKFLLYGGITPKPESTDGRREGWANWDEGAYKVESLGSIETKWRGRGFSVAAPGLESGLGRLGIA